MCYSICILLAVLEQQSGAEGNDASITPVFFFFVLYLLAFLGKCTISAYRGILVFTFATFNKFGLRYLLHEQTIMSSLRY
jgi:hypothetical protein